MFTRAAAIVFPLIAASGVPAQAMSSTNYFMPSIEMASGQSATSTNYAGHLSFGNGVIPNPATSLSYRIPGGFAATLDVSPAGKPWVTHVEPAFVMPKGGAAMTVHGFGLNLGTSPVLEFGGRAATINSRAASRVTANLPAGVAPGYPSVRMTSTVGSTTAEDTFGVLPLIYADPAPAPNQKFTIVFKGTRGDSVIWAIGALPGSPIPIPPLLYGLALNPAAMLLLPGFSITHASGEFHMPIPASSYVSPLYIQAVFSSSNPGYSPGSFSNTLRF